MTLPLRRPARSFFAASRLGRGFVGASLIVGIAALLSGCQGRSVGGTAQDWLHGVEGGEIAKLRPPPPGFTQPYPNIALQPKTKLDFPTPQARAALTEKLESERNYAQRLSAASGPLPTLTRSNAPPPVNTDASMTLSSDGGSPPPPPAQPIAVPGAPTSTLTSPPSGPAPLQYAPTDRSLPKKMPPIITPPPPPIGFPGFAIPETHEKLIPDFATADPTGALVRFEPSSDVLTSGQEKTFAKLVSERGRRKIVLTGFGVSLGPEAGLRPEEQTAEIALALLRAQAVADVLAARGVPASALLLAAQPIGNGVRARYEGLP